MRSEDGRERRGRREQWAGKRAAGGSTRVAPHWPKLLGRVPVAEAMVRCEVLRLI